MEEKNRELLENSIEMTLNAILDMEVGSQEYTAAVNSLKTLSSICHEQVEQAKNLEMVEIEHEMKLKSAADNRKAAIIGHVINGAKVVGELAIAGVTLFLWDAKTERGFKFEETGTYTSNTMKWILSNFRPKI